MTDADVTLPAESGEDPGERERRLSEALAQYSDLEARGVPVDLLEFCEQYPDLAPELRESILTMLSLEPASDRAKETAPAGSSAMSGSSRAAHPLQLSGCRILSEIGSGGMGCVLAAMDERLERRVAIKTLAPRFQEDNAIRARFMSEARSLARLSHPNIVRIYGLGSADEMPHFIMEYIDGAPLTEAAKPLPIGLKLELMRKVVRAVQYLHEHGIIHRDLKPGNILVGRDLEPRLLDFGLARHLDLSPRGRTLPGDLIGTPEYFSPEQARGESVDERTDIFSLGTVLFELLTGRLPFEGKDLSEQVEKICHADAPLPRSLDGAIPGEVQNICMKALEKNPSERYPNARELGDDLERFMAGEPVLAAPASYTRRMSGQVEQHLKQLDRWRRDQILSDYEFDALERNYSRLLEREDAWIMEVRRLSLPQVALYLGAWLLSVGAALLFLFRYAALPGIAAFLLVGLATASVGLYGIRCWKSDRLRIAMAYLLASCLLVPTSFLIGFHEAGVFSRLTEGKEELEFFFQFDQLKPTTNAQFWWALALSLPVYLWLRRFTRSSVFSLVLAAAAAGLCLVTLLRMGLLEHLPDDQGWLYLRLIPAALLFFVAASSLERLRQPADSRYFYPIAVFFTFISFSGLAAFHEPYARWLDRVFPWTRGQIEYLFIANAGLYFLLQLVCSRFSSAQMRGVSKVFRFVIPTHVLTSLLLLGLEATWRFEERPSEAARLWEARTFEALLPLTASFFVFWSVPRQMKNYLGTGLIFLAIGIVRLQQNWLRDRAEWPVFLIALGVGAMVLAARYSSIRTALSRWLGKLRGH